MRDCSRLSGRSVAMDTSEAPPSMDAMRTPALQDVPSFQPHQPPARATYSRGALSTSVTSQYPRPVSGPPSHAPSRSTSSTQLVRQVPGSSASLDNMATASHVQSHAPRILHRGRTIVATRARAVTPRSVHVTGATPGGGFRQRAPMHVRHETSESKM